MKRRIIVILIIGAVIIGVSQYYKQTSAGTSVEEVERKRGTIAKLIEVREVRDGEVVFYLIQNGERSPVLSADYVNKSFLGWNWSTGGRHSLPSASTADVAETDGTDTEGTDTEGIEPTDTAWSFQYMAATKGSFFNHTPFPLVFGTVNHSAIAAVRIKSVQTGEEVDAEVIEIDGALKLWYAFITEEQGRSLELSGLTADGEIVSEKRY